MSKQFDGEGFSRNPIEGEEAARHRQFFSEGSKLWPTLNEAVIIVQAFSVAHKILRIGVPVGAAGLVMGAYARAQGWI